MKRIKIIPLIIAILFPLVVTGFIVCYSYGVGDAYTANKTKYQNEVNSMYYSAENNAEEEIEKNIKFLSNKYREITPQNYTERQSGNFKTKFYEYTYFQDMLEDDEVVKKEYYYTTLFLYDINYKEFDSKTFKNEGVVIDSNSSVSVLYVKGIGEPANNKIQDVVDLMRSNTPFDELDYGNVNIIDSYETQFIDHDKTGSDSTEYVMKASFINSTKGDDVLTFDDLKDIYDETEIDDVTEGYTCYIINWNQESDTKRNVKIISTFTTDVKQPEDFDKLENLETGYKEDYAEAGFSYISFIWPTLLWQGLVSLVLTGILGVLFYAIWSTDAEPKNQKMKLK